MNTEQFKGQLRLWLVAAFGALGGWAVHAHLFTTEQVSGFLNSQLGVAIIGLLTTAIFSYLNKTNTNLAAMAGTVPHTVVVTTPEIAAATPTQANIVSNTDSPAQIAAVVKAGT